MNTYILKNGEEVTAIPIGKTNIVIGEVSPDGMLIVCDRGPTTGNNRGACVICKCICGNYTMLKLQAFRNGTTKSCGCYNKKIHKELCKNIGQQSHFKDYRQVENPFYNFLNPTKEKNSNNSLYWEIECKRCGKIYKAIPIEVISNTRRRGSNPCPCQQFHSKGVIKIENLLKENNISYEKEKSFTTCLSPKGNLLKFDFWINNTYLIEYDGEQHFMPTSFGGTIDGNDRLKQQQEYDTIKNQWCINNGVILIRIPYTHYQDLKIEDLLITSIFKI